MINFTCEKHIFQNYICDDEHEIERWFSLWWRTDARDVRIYCPYRQYTNILIFRIVSLFCLLGTLRLCSTSTSRARVQTSLFWTGHWSTNKGCRSAKQTSPRSFQRSRDVRRNALKISMSRNVWYLGVRTCRLYYQLNIRIAQIFTYSICRCKHLYKYF